VDASVTEDDAVKILPTRAAREKGVERPRRRGARGATTTRDDDDDDDARREETW
tara:strand:+ start:682 stop:843 length:162 start_codon:yes stop_codon:yes gene_type:complete